MGCPLASLKSTRTCRNHVQRSLELLQLCDANGVLSHITLCQDHLLAWLEDKAVSSLPGTLVVHEVDKNGDFVANSHTDVLEP